jgi:hypothetical protein
VSCETPNTSASTHKLLGTDVAVVGLVAVTNVILVVHQVHLTVFGHLSAW